MSQKQRINEAKKAMTGVKSKVYQRRPYTVAFMTATVNGETYDGVGVTKVCWPDWWSSTKGKNIAIGKAEKHIAKQALGLDGPWDTTASGEVHEIPKALRVALDDGAV